MQKALLILSVAMLAVTGSSAAAWAGSYGYHSCDRQYSYHPAYSYRPVYGYGYSYHPAYSFRPVYGYGYRVVPQYRFVAVPTWHRHYIGRRYVRCHYYGGVHHYDGAYRPASQFHIGVSIFR